ncbi:hypothetical protein [uncultured Sulfitobacter sp.]|uniref:hypothetical protein n=1 Tax=uncultured Sulfitobacter sp. TaxID=191468 RepID=UPI0026387FD9|nr:hypothetical protein [uncultured Sulfitobacter sp.]
MKQYLIPLLLIAAPVSANEDLAQQALTCLVKEVSPEIYASNNCKSFRNGMRYAQQRIGAVQQGNGPIQKFQQKLRPNDSQQFYDQLNERALSASPVQRDYLQ